MGGTGDCKDFKGVRMKPYNATPEQIAQLKEHGKITLCVPTVTQPPERWKLCLVHGSNAEFTDTGKPQILAVEVIPLQYPVGTVIGVRETWDHSELSLIGGGVERIGYIYKANGYLPCTHWHSSATMPAKAIRYHPTVVGNTVKRVQDVTNTELHKMGYIVSYINYDKQEFIDWFNSRYAKPRPRRKNGKIVGYECWCWDDSFIINNSGMIAVRADGFYLIDRRKVSNDWKPLIVRFNPYCEVVECEVE